MKTRFVGIVLGIVLALVSGASSAQFGGLLNAISGGGGGGGLMGALGGGGGGGMGADQIVSRYVSGTQSIMSANAKMLGALGMYDLSAKHLEAVSNLSGSTSTSTLEQAARVLAEGNQALEAKLGQSGVAMDANGRMQFVMALRDISKGFKDYKGLVGDIKGFKPSLASVGDMPSALFIVQSLPDSVGNVLNSIRRAVSFATSNNIDVPVDATSLL